MIWLFSFWILGRRRKDVLPCLAVPNGWSRSIEFSKHPIPISAIPSRNVSTKCNIYLCCHNHTNINGQNILSRTQNFLRKTISCHSIQTMWNVQKEHNRQKDNLKCCLIFSISCIHMKENEDLIFWTITIPKKLKYFIREDHFKLQRCLNNHNICHVQCKTDVIIHI